MAAKSKAKSPRLGRGLSALMAQPVKLAPEEATLAETEQSSSREAAAAPSPAQSPGKPSPALKPGRQSSASADLEGAQGQSSASAQAAQAAQAAPEGGIVYLSPTAIRPNPHQPRQMFDEAALRRLADSIASAGLMQPIIVRRIAAGQAGDGTHTHEIIAGERRWRAVQLAGLTALPALVRDLSDHESAQWALVENLQREDLNPIERAEAFHRLADQFGLSHEQIAQRVGVERPTVSNSLRLLDLDDQVKQWVRLGRLSAGHGRALVALADHAQQRLLGERVIRRELSVRELEQAVRQANGQSGQAGQAQAAGRRSGRAAHLADLEQQIGGQLETKVRIRPGRRKGSGTLSIDFYSVDQFDALLRRLDVDTE